MNSQSGSGSQLQKCASRHTFILPIRVYYEDTDAGGVVYHSNYLSFFERARTEWLRQLGYELDELLKDDGILFVVRSLTCNYLKPAVFNDELFVSAEITRLGKTSIVFEQKIMRAADNDKTAGKQETGSACVTLAQGEVTVVSVDAALFKPKRLPQNLMESIQSVI